MSNDVRPGVKIHFEDKERTVYPVSLRQLRKLRAALEKVDFDNADSGMPDEDTVDAMVKAAQIVLEKIDPDLAGNYESVEDIVDIRAFNEMIGAAMGIDPNEQGVAVKAE